MFPIQRFRECVMIEQELFPQFTKPQEDARDLIARLYREIGITAVAAALHVNNAKPEDRPAAQLEATARKKSAA
jgi:hypothetical protein